MIWIISLFVFWFMIIIRIFMVNRYYNYWTEVIYDYGVYCIFNKQPRHVTFEDLREWSDYFWDFWEWRRGEMLVASETRNPSARKILEDWLGERMFSGKGGNR